jgi:hypothetical protein
MASKMHIFDAEGRCAKSKNDFSGAYNSTAVRPVTAVFAACDVPVLDCRLTGAERIPTYRCRPLENWCISSYRNFDG